MIESSSNYSLVLIGRYPGKDMAVAQALARCMGREESWGLRIVSSSPIVFFDKLDKKQAGLLDTALSEVANAGCRFEIQPGSVSSLPKVGWAHPPKINGRTLGEIAPGAETHPPPHTPNLTPVSATQPPAYPRPIPAAPSVPFVPAAPLVPSASGTPKDASEPEHESTQGTATLFLACPYTGQSIKLTLNIALSRGEQGPSLRVTASAVAPVGRAPEKKSANSISGTVIPPSAPPMRQTGPQMQIRHSGANARPTVAIPLDFGFSDKRGDSSLVSPVESHTPVASTPIPPSPSPWRKRTPAGVSLPDVPDLPSLKMPFPKSAVPEIQPLPLDGMPMDISTFEANLAVDSNAAERPYVNPDSVVFEDNDDVLADSGDILCSVYIERSSSPVVHELVAELHGIPESEASEMCVAGSVALAENIPLFEAQDIKTRCAEINVFARIVRQD